MENAFFRVRAVMLVVLLALFAGIGVQNRIGCDSRGWKL
jgi:hypothetical protein